MLALGLLTPSEAMCLWFGVDVGGGDRTAAVLIPRLSTEYANAWPNCQEGPRGGGERREAERRVKVGCESLKEDLAE